MLKSWTTYCSAVTWGSWTTRDLWRLRGPMCDHQSSVGQWTDTADFSWERLQRTPTGNHKHVKDNIEAIRRNSDQSLGVVTHTQSRESGAERLPNQSTKTQDWSEINTFPSRTNTHKSMTPQEGKLYSRWSAMTSLRMKKYCVHVDSRPPGNHKKSWKCS